MNARREHVKTVAIRRGASLAALVFALGLSAALAGGAAATLATEPPAAEPRVDSILVQRVANGGGEFEQPLGVAFDAAAGEVVVANTGTGRVEFFGLDGSAHGYFTHRITDAQGNERDGLPKHVAVDPQGRLLVVDALAAYVDLCDFRGTSLAHLTLPAPDDDLGKGGPGPVAVAPDGSIFVASRSRQGRVHVFDAEGKLLQSWGVAGTEPGQLRAIAGIAIAPCGEVAITCVLTQLGVQIFARDGTYLRGFGIHDIGPGRFSVPNGIIITPDSRIWVSDAMRQNIQVFDAAGKLLGVLGGGDGPGEMLYPSALASDGRSLLALVETGGKALRLMWVR